MIRQEHRRQGTAVSKDYQKKTVGTSATELPVPVAPDVVSVAMDEIAAEVGEGLLAIAVGAGLQVMAAMMAADVEELCGPRGKHDPDRTATRHGTEAGSVSLGGRRVGVRRPRVRAVASAGPARSVFVAWVEAIPPPRTR